MVGKIPFFIIGATGYIGGTVLSRLLSHPSSATFEITALVRSEEKAKRLQEKFGVKSVVGSYADVALVEKLAENAHFVLSLADSDDVPAMKATLRGLKKRHEQTGDLPVLIHTSGTGVFTEGQDTKGMAASDLIYDDLDFEQIAGISPTAIHRNVDNLTFAADAEGYCRTYVVLPGIVYGIAQTALVSAGIQNAHTLMSPMLIRAALDRGYAGIVGKGLSIWPSVHIDDVADLFVLLFDTIVSKGPDNVDHGARGYYIAENGEVQLYKLSRAIGDAAAELGQLHEPEPTAFTDEELVKYFGSVEMGSYFGTNARCRANHARALGWAPKYTTEDLLASMKPEVEAILQEKAEGVIPKGGFSSAVLERFNIAKEA